MTVSIGTARYDSAPAGIRKIPLLQPFVWLWRGARDTLHCAPVNLGHGLLMAALGWVLLLMLGNHPYFVVAAVSGFLLAAPVMTAGLVELSRRRAARESLGFDASLSSLAANRDALLRFGAVLALLTLGWFAASEVMLRAVFQLGAPGVAETYYTGFLDAAHRPMVLAYVLAGGLLALVVLAISLVTVPLMIDRHAGAGEAMRASLRALGANPLPLALWAALIVVVTAAGFATLLAGMVVLIPLLGHATWHAYRDLVG